MIRPSDRRHGTLNRAEIRTPGHGFTYLPGSHQYVLDGDHPIEVSPEEEGLLWRYFLGLRVLHMFERMSYKPSSLVSDPLRGCQLRCSYCYSEVWNDDGTRVSPARFKELQEKFHFTSLSVYGGDPFYDWGYLKDCLENMNTVSPLNQLLLSTNGLGATEERVRWLKDHVPNLVFQLSTEPESWGARKTANGKHQRVVLGDKIHAVSKITPIQVALAIPVAGLARWESLDKTIAYFQDVVGDTEAWNINWKLEESDKPAPAYDQARLPPWYAEWLRDEWFAAMATDGSYTLSRHRRGLASTRVSSLLRLLEPGTPPMAFFSCAAGFGSLGLGPDGNLASCHHMAAVGDPKYRFDDLTVRGMWKLMARETQHLANDVCMACMSRYTCGGICYSALNNITCEANRATLDLALFVLTRHFPIRAKELSAAFQHATRRNLSVVKDLKGLLRSPVWGALTRATLPIEEIADLVESFRGVRPELDTPVWALPEPTRG